MSTDIENPNVAALLRQIEGLVGRISKCEIERDEARAARDFAELACDKAGKERDEFHRCLLAREKSLKEEGEAWVKAMTERDEARSQVERLHADGAVMRGALEKARKSYNRAFAKNVGELELKTPYDNALSTSCGADLLKKLKNLEQLNVDACSDDTAIRDLCRPVLGRKLCDGDSNGVPSIVDIVESLLAGYRDAVELLRGAEPQPCTWQTCDKWRSRRDTILDKVKGDL